MVTANAATLADALAAIRELKTLVQKQAEEIADLKKELAAAKAEITTWHLTVRIGRKLLAHTINCFLNRKFGNPILQFERIFN